MTIFIFYYGECNPIHFASFYAITIWTTHSLSMNCLSSTQLNVTYFFSCFNIHDRINTVTIIIDVTEGDIGIHTPTVEFYIKTLQRTCQLTNILILQVMTEFDSHSIDGNGFFFTFQGGYNQFGTLIQSVCCCSVVICCYTFTFNILLFQEIKLLFSTAFTFAQGIHQILLTLHSDSSKHINY